MEFEDLFPIKVMQKRRTLQSGQEVKGNQLSKVREN